MHRELEDSKARTSVLEEGYSNKSFLLLQEYSCFSLHGGHRG